MIQIIGPLFRSDGETSKQPLSLQKQLVAHIQQAILSGRLLPGETLMSSRLLAKELGVSRNTVLNAYDHLIAEGYVLADRKGTRVAQVRPSQDRLEKTEKSLSTPIVLARRCESISGFSAPRLDAPLSPGVPSLDDFPLAAWRRSIETSFKRQARLSLNYNDPLGEMELREAIASHLRIARDVHCQPEQVVVTQGTHQALTLCVSLLTNPGDTAFVEDPGYRGAKIAFNVGELRTVPMPVDADGIDVPIDAWTKHHPRLIYCSPAHQYPTGSVLSVARRLDLISRCKSSGCWLIEDDYDGEFRHSGEPIASMQGLEHNSPVIYVGSFSKTMFPSLRIGFFVLPLNLIPQTKHVIPPLLGGGHAMHQYSMAHFMKSGEFGRHLRRMRRLYRERQDVLRKALTNYFDDEAIMGGSAGMHLTLRLPAGVNDIKVAESARSLGLGVRALSPFFLDPKRSEHGLVIGYGNTPSNQLIEAVTTLAVLVNQ